MLGAGQRRWEPVEWAVEALEAATAAWVRQLPRLLTAASFCSFLGRPEVAYGYSQAALRLEAAGDHDPFAAGWAGQLDAMAQGYAGRMESMGESLARLSAPGSPARPRCLALYVYVLATLNRSAEALALADEAVAVARSRANPHWIVEALLASGRALERSEPDRALTVLREAHHLARVHSILTLQSRVALDIAGLEARYGDADRALQLLDETVASFHRGGELPEVAYTIVNLAMLFDRLDQPETAATLAGIATDGPKGAGIVALPDVVERLRARLGDAATDAAIATGAHMDLATGVGYSRDQIAIAQRERAQRRVD
jgi:hypothetical protein